MIVPRFVANLIVALVFLVMLFNSSASVRGVFFFAFVAHGVINLAYALATAKVQLESE